MSERKGWKYRLLRVAREPTPVINGGRCVLSSQQVGWKPLLRPLYPLVTLSPLMQDDVDDFVVFANIFCRCRHHVVDDLAEKLNIASGIVSYT